MMIMKRTDVGVNFVKSIVKMCCSVCADPDRIEEKRRRKGDWLNRVMPSSGRSGLSSRIKIMRIVMITTMIIMMMMIVMRMMIVTGMMIMTVMMMMIVMRMMIVTGMMIMTVIMMMMIVMRIILLVLLVLVLGLLLLLLLPPPPPPPPPSPSRPPLLLLLLLLLQLLTVSANCLRHACLCVMVADMQHICSALWQEGITQLLTLTELKSSLFIDL